MAHTPDAERRKGREDQTFALRRLPLNAGAVENDGSGEVGEAEETGQPDRSHDSGAGRQLELSLVSLRVPARQGSIRVPRRARNLLVVCISLDSEYWSVYDPGTTQ